MSTMSELEFLARQAVDHFGLSRGVGHGEQLVIFGLRAQHQILGMAYAGWSVKRR